MPHFPRTVLAILILTLSALYSNYFIKTPMMAQMSRSIVKSVLAREMSEGVGAVVRRSIGTSALKNLSPFLMLDHFNVPRGAGFSDHPHRGQSTVTYMLEGSFQHEDSVGNRGLIGPGDVQWMTAGRGIIHAEVLPVHTPGGPNPSGLQLWVDLPAEHKMTAPNYQELNASQIPSAYPSGPSGPRIRVISGITHGVESPVRPLGGCWYMDVELPQKDDSVFIDLPTGWTSFIYTYTGSLLVGASSTPSEPFHTLVLSSGANETGIELKGATEKTRCFLIAGEPLEQKVVQYGPFVMTSDEDIQKAFMDYRTGRNGFEKAGTWESEIAKDMR